MVMTIKLDDGIKNLRIKKEEAEIVKKFLNLSIYGMYTIDNILTDDCSIDINFIEDIEIEDF